MSPTRLATRALMTDAHRAVSRLGEPAPEDRQGGKEVQGALPGARLPREGGDQRRGGGEHGGEQPSALVEPDPRTQHRFGEKGQLVRVVEQVGELRNDEDEHEEHRGEAGHDENGGIHQRAPDLGRRALVVLHLRDRLAERPREIPARLARLHQVVDVAGKREPAGVQGKRESSVRAGATGQWRRRRSRAPDAGCRGPARAPHRPATPRTPEGSRARGTPPPGPGGGNGGGAWRGRPPCARRPRPPYGLRRSASGRGP